MSLFRKKKNILVLGIDGMLGHDVYNFLLDASVDETSKIGTVIGIGRNNNKLVNIIDLGAFSYFLDNSIKFDYCINCIAYTDTNAIENTTEGKIKSYDSNVEVANVVSRNCAIRKIKLIHVSTDYVFGGEKSFTNFFMKDINSERRFTSIGYGSCVNGYGRCSNPYPMNVYGAHKLLAETMILLNYAKEGLSKKYYIILRTSWLYGAYRSKSFVHKIIKNAARCYANKEKLQVTESEISIPTSTMYVALCIYYGILRKTFNGIMHAVPYCAISDAPSRYVFARSIFNVILKFYEDNKDSNKKDSLNLKSLVDISSYILDHNIISIKTEDYHPLISVLELTADFEYLNTIFGNNIFTWQNIFYRFVRQNYKLLEQFAEEALNEARSK